MAFLMIFIIIDKLYLYSSFNLETNISNHDMDSKYCFNFFKLFNLSLISQSSSLLMYVIRWVHLLVSYKEFSYSLTGNWDDKECDLWNLKWFEHLISCLTSWMPRCLVDLNQDLIQFHTEWHFCKFHWHGHSSPISYQDHLKLEASKIQISVATYMLFKDLEDPYM